MISPHLSNEDLFIAQQFVRQVVGSENIAASIMLDLGDDLSPFLDLVTQSDPINTIEDVDAILTFGYSIEKAENKKRYTLDSVVYFNEYGNKSDDKGLFPLIKHFKKK